MMICNKCEFRSVKDGLMICTHKDTINEGNIIQWDMNFENRISYACPIKARELQLELMAKVLDIPLSFIQELVEFKEGYDGDWSDVTLYVP